MEQTAEPNSQTAADTPPHVDPGRQRRGRGPAPASLVFTTVWKRSYRRRPNPDPTAPPRPRSAYSIFVDEFRRNSTPCANGTDEAIAASERWRTLTPDDRNAYDHRADAEKEQYDRNLALYERSENYVVRTVGAAGRLGGQRATRTENGRAVRPHSSSRVRPFRSATSDT